MHRGASMPAPVTRQDVESAIVDATVAARLAARVAIALLDELHEARQRPDAGFVSITREWCAEVQFACDVAADRAREVERLFYAEREGRADG